MADNASAASRRLIPFHGCDPSRDYRRMYRALVDFHERFNNPPPGMDDDDYWRTVGDAMLTIARQFNCDVFVIRMLWEIADELHREAKARKAEW